MKTANCQPLAYRPDIDGLRAFAVLSVVAYHTFPEWVKGGFIGVDVFFVISGYLIGGIILRDLEQGTFSFRDFYSRRIRRIFPALIVVLASALAFGWFALLPEEFKSLGKHVLGGSTFVSNFVLWQESGYFDVEAKAKPFLHLWSLGIEEQFYIFFPLLLWLCFRKRWKVSFWIVLLLLVSFYFNIYLHGNDKTADFYSPLSRIWELFAGVVCVLFTKCDIAPNKKFYIIKTVYYPVTENNDKIVIGNQLGRSNYAVAALGVVLLVTALLRIDDSISYPGWMAVLPVAGAMCLILADAKNWISKWILSNPVTVFIGKVSYPFYLWHWVFISFAFIINGGFDTLSFNIKVSIILISYIFSVITYFFIERPVRFNVKYRRGKIYILICLMCLMGGLSGIIYNKNGFPSRYSIPEYVDRVIENFWDAYSKCTENFPKWKKMGTGCEVSESDNKISMAIIGDSYALHLMYGMIEKNNHGVIGFHSGCASPYINTTNKLVDKECKGYSIITDGYHYILNDGNIKNVIIYNRSNCFREGVVDIEHKNIEDAGIALRNGIRRTLEMLLNDNKKVDIILEHPYLPFEPGKCASRNIPFYNYSTICKFDRKIHDNDKFRNWYKDILYSTTKEYKNIKIVDLTDLFCDKEYCYVSKNGKLLYRDRGHLSVDGSLYVAGHLLNIINN